jgi:hypothetical protein
LHLAGFHRVFQFAERAQQAAAIAQMPLGPRIRPNSTVNQKKRDMERMMLVRRPVPAGSPSDRRGES